MKDKSQSSIQKSELSDRSIPQEELSITPELQQVINQSKNVLGLLSEGIVIYSPDARVQMWNGFMENITGVKEEQVKNKKLSELFNSESEEQIYKHLDDILKGKAPYALEYKVKVNNTGKIIFLRKILNVINDSSGKILGVIGEVKDISDRKHFEEALKKSNELLNLFFKHSPIYVFIKEVTSTESKVIMLSDNYKQMTGIESDNLKGKTMDQIFPSEFADKITKDDIAVVSKGKIIEEEEEFNDRKYLTIKYPITQSDRVLLAGYTIDITDIKNIENDLRATKDLLLSITNGTEDFIYTKSLEGEYTFINKAFKNFAGISEDEIIGNKLTDVFTDDEASGLLKMDEAVKTKEKNILSEDVIRNLSGDKKEVSILKGPIHNSEGELSGIFGISRDITEVKENARSIKVMKEQLERVQRMDSLGALAGGIGHDINNLLTPLIGYLELALMGPKNPEKTSEFMNKSINAAKKIAKLISKLQNLSKNSVSVKSSLDIHKIVTDVNELVLEKKNETENAYMKIEVDFDKGDFYALGNEVELSEVLLNLGINSVLSFAERGAREGDLIKIKAEEYTSIDLDSKNLPVGDYVHISFQDNGNGMSETVKRKAFDPLFTTRKEKRGQGFGLYMVYNIIINKHNGHVSLESKEGEGTTVHLYIPKSTKEHKIKVESTVNNKGGNETILVIEDEEEIQQLVTYLLESYGYNVIIAKDGREGLDIYTERKNDVNLVLLDLTMPQMSGQDVLENILKINKDVKVVISSGQNSEETKRTLNQAKGFVHKPYPIKELTKTIRKVIDEE